MLMLDATPPMLIEVANELNKLTDVADGARIEEAVTAVTEALTVDNMLVVVLKVRFAEDPKELLLLNWTCVLLPAGVAPTVTEPLDPVEIVVLLPDRKSTRLNSSHRT